MFYLRYLCCLHTQLFVGGLMFYLSYLCLSLPPVVCVGELMSCLRYLCLSLPPVVCRRAHVLFTLFVLLAHCVVFVLFFIVLCCQFL